MSNGYTPLFNSMLSGTLYGRWPHTGIWACLLSRASREGVIDETPQALAAAIGVPLETLLECIADFMAPDPNSRSMDNEGRRLVLVEERRTWGWVVVNHGKYREKARKKNYDQQRTESGIDAERKRAERAQAISTESVPTRPAKSRAVPLSEAEAKAYKKPAEKGSRIPPDFQPDLSYAKQQVPDMDVSSEAAGFLDYWQASSSPTAVKRDWQAAWRTWVRNCKTNGRYARRAANNGIHAGVVMR